MLLLLPYICNFVWFNVILCYRSSILNVLFHICIYVRNFHVLSGSRNTTVTSDFRPEVEIWPFRACAMHPAIIIGTIRSLWTWLWGRYHVPQNVFLVCV